MPREVLVFLIFNLSYCIIRLRQGWKFLIGRRLKISFFRFCNFEFYLHSLSFSLSLSLSLFLSKRRKCEREIFLWDRVFGESLRLQHFYVTLWCTDSKPRFCPTMLKILSRTGATGPCQERERSDRERRFGFALRKKDRKGEKRTDVKDRVRKKKLK